MSTRDKPNKPSKPSKSRNTHTQERQVFKCTVSDTIRKHELVVIHHQLQHLYNALIDDGKIFASERLLSALSKSEKCTMSALIRSGLRYLDLIDEEAIL